MLDPIGGLFENHQATIGAQLNAGLSHRPAQKAVPCAPGDQGRGVTRVSRKDATGLYMLFEGPIFGVPSRVAIQ